MSIWPGWKLRSFIMVAAALLIAQPLMAQRVFAPVGDGNDRPPLGYARPPVFVIGNASVAPYGLAPQNVRHAYGFDLLSNRGAGQTIAIVDAYDDANIASDLSIFSSQFGLPQCTSANGCFRKIYANRSKPLANSSWSLEISLDVEWAHAIAPQARILLVEAASSSFTNLLKAVDVAVQNGASVVSMSFGGSEYSSERSSDTHFSHNGVTFVASSGDGGSGVEYPAASPFVVAVGGTRLNFDSNGNYLSETAWAGSGGGLSFYEFEPFFQANFPIPNDPAGKRAVPDVAYDGDPNTGFAVYDSIPLNGQRGWFQAGGTSAGAPQWAALFAIANSMRAAARKAALSSTNTLLYNRAKTSFAVDFHDVTSGTNGTCGTNCTAAPKYDFVTGLGSPQANHLIPALVSQ